MLTLGDYDRVHCSNSCNWINLTSTKYYQFALDSVHVHNVKTNYSSQIYQINNQAISDTGSAFIEGPDAIIKAIGKEVGATWNDTTKLVKLVTYNHVLYS